MSAALPLVWQDGGIVPATSFRMAPDDPALLHGLGAFTTTWASPERVRLWDDHSARLRETAAALGFTCAPLPSAAELLAFVHRLGATACSLRCNVSPSGRVWCLARPLPPLRAAVALAVEAAPWAENDPWGTFKTFHYAQRWLAGQRAAAAGADDVLLVNGAGLALETSRANVFALVSDGWRTPPLGPGILPGVVRGEIIRRFAVREAPLTLDQLRQAHEVCVTNSVRGVEPVAMLAGQPLASGAQWRNFLPALEG